MRRFYVIAQNNHFVRQEIFPKVAMRKKLIDTYF